MINTNYARLVENYLFAEVGKKTDAYRSAHPEARIIRMGIGDVTRPLCPAVTEALAKAALEFGTAEGFFGYGPYQGYDFLREPIRDYYAARGVRLEPDEIFVSNGAKDDVAGILDIFSRDCVILTQDPVYPVYVDANVMDGREILYADATPENGYLPLPDENVHADLIYLCSPNNPCGVAYTADQLALWVDYAKRQGSVILFDAAYEAYVKTPGVPHSIYEVEGAKECAIEFCSLSKTAGFTGVRSGYTIVPLALVRDGQSLNKMWFRRQSTKYNGASALVQKGAAAVFTPEGMRQTAEQRAYYLENARIITETLDQLGVAYSGGVDSPYIWMDCPEGMGSWTYFDRLLEEIQVVGTPGAGFGRNGEGHFRLTSFSTHENTREAMERLARWYAARKA